MQPVRYDHLLNLIDDTGIYEHALYGVPRRDHGYTLDDAARALILLCQADPATPVERALTTLLGFVLHAQTEDGRFHNRMSFDRRWIDLAGSDDAHGRGVWAVGFAGWAAPRSEQRQAAHDAWGRIMVIDSPYLRPHAYSVLGAHAHWQHQPDDPMVERIVDSFIRHLPDGASAWPEPRLTYANGRIPDAVLAAGEITGRSDLIDRGLEMLDWLIEVETRGDHYSFTPVGGWAPAEPRPGFDQQPIEAAALADAAARAFAITGAQHWRAAVDKAASWLAGANDVGVALYDPTTGATFDGLTGRGPNLNRGAESTIAGLAVLHAWRRLAAPLPASGSALTTTG